MIKSIEKTNENFELIAKHFGLLERNKLSDGRSIHTIWNRWLDGNKDVHKVLLNLMSIYVPLSVQTRTFTESNTLKLSYTAFEYGVYMKMELEFDTTNSSELSLYLQTPINLDFIVELTEPEVAVGILTHQLMALRKENEQLKQEKFRQLDDFFNNRVAN